MTWLALLPAGSHALVRDLPRGRGLARRLIAMGLVPGAEVYVLQNRGRGPLIVEVHGVRLALGWRQAAWVAVEPLTPPGLEEPGAAAELEGSTGEA